MYNKIGYGTKSDSILGTSFQNILLVLYGEVSIGYSDLDVTDQVELTDLPTFEKWDVQYGRYGIKYWIKDETCKTEAQLGNWI